ncbi:MAG: hypothetical protein ABW056_02685, partial [Thermoanaerobaculia bacterium]
MRRSRRASFLCAGVILGVAASVAAGDTAADEAEVRGRSRGVAEAEARKDADSVMPFWTEDAIVHFNGEAPLKGREA